MNERQSALYFGDVMHQRVRPRRHRLCYRVFFLFADLDELDDLDRRLSVFSYNRFNLFGFCDKDHGPGDGRPLRGWVEGHLAEAGIDLGGGAIRLLCFPRVLGYVFNPLTVYFCYRPSGHLAAILYEVNNTFGERHTYLVPVEAEAAGALSHSCDKQFYVSPFNAVEGGYSFRVELPAEAVTVVINQSDAEGPLLHAALRAKRVPLTQRSLLTAFVRYPLLTLKVIGGIHWEALRLWGKGLRLVDRPRPPARPVTVVMPSKLQPTGG
jgi:hypothetical protein